MKESASLRRYIDRKIRQKEICVPQRKKLDIENHHIPCTRAYTKSILALTRFYSIWVERGNHESWMQRGENKPSQRVPDFLAVSGSLERHKGVPSRNPIKGVHLQTSWSFKNPLSLDISSSFPYKHQPPGLCAAWEKCCPGNLYRLCLVVVGWSFRHSLKP